MAHFLTVPIAPSRRPLLAAYRGVRAKRSDTWSATRWFAVPLLIALSTLSCGRKAPPRPPEDVAPKTIADLAATNAPEGIRLSWSRPLIYMDGTRMQDLAGFVIERAAANELRPAFKRVTVLEVSDRDRFRQEKRFQYVDPDTVSGDDYQYRVVSFTLDRYFSAPSNIVTISRAHPGEETHAPLPGTQR